MSTDYEGRNTTNARAVYDTEATPPSQEGGDKQPTPCLPQAATLMLAMSGTLPWTDSDQRCGQQWTWLLSLPHTHGVGVRFHDVQLTQGRSLEILSFHDIDLQWAVERKFLENDLNSSLIFPASIINLSPLLVNRSQVKIVVSPALRLGEAEPPSFFNLSYSAHVKHDMPSEAQNFGTTLIGYDCASGSVPDVLRCNKIRECEGGEDEEDCEYRVEGCDVGWVSYGRQCLIADFTVSCHLYDCDPSTGELGPTLPEMADKLCGFWFDATLAVLPDRQGLTLVASLVRQSGFRSVALNIRKFRATNKKLLSLYRHVWQWGGRGGPIAYDQQELENVGPEHSCAMLDVYPRPRFVPTDCARYSTRLVFPNGFVCMKANPRLAEQPATPLPPLEPVVFSRAWSFLDLSHRGVIDGMRVKECSDGSVVHNFDRCLWGDKVTGVEWSPNHFPLFSCRFGLQVHYTLVCDGKGDCADGSDEDNCAPPRFDPTLEFLNMKRLL